MLCTSLGKALHQFTVAWTDHIVSVLLVRFGKPRKQMVKALVVIFPVAVTQRHADIESAFLPQTSFCHYLTILAPAASEIHSFLICTHHPEHSDCHRHNDYKDQSQRGDRQEKRNDHCHRMLSPYNPYSQSFWYAFFTIPAINFLRCSRKSGYDIFSKSTGRAFSAQAFLYPSSPSF